MYLRENRRWVPLMQVQKRFINRVASCFLHKITFLFNLTSDLVWELLQD